MHSKNVHIIQGTKIRQEMKKLLIQKREMSTIQFSVMASSSITTLLYHKLQTQEYWPTIVVPLKQCRP